MIHVYAKDGKSHVVKIEGSGLELSAEIALILQNFTAMLRKDNMPEPMIKTLIEGILYAAFKNEEEE